jgi:hypothetical protein
MHRTVVAVAASALILGGCGQGGNATATAPSAASPAVAAASCPIISAADASAAYGAALSDTPANSLPQSQSCQFSGAGDTMVMIQVAPARYYEEHNGKDFRSVPGLGDKASISFELGGWRAVASQRDKTAVVMTQGPAAKQENTLAVLKAVLAKL